MVNPVQCLAVTALGDMCCTTTSTLSPTPGACLVKVHYSTLNRLDTLQRSGKMAPPAGASDILGLEFSGTIVHSPLPHLVPGDRVAGLVSHCGHSEYTYCDPQHLFKIPDSYPLRSAACIPENWITAYQLITAVGGLSPSSTVLIHAAASGVGLALIQLCMHYLKAPVIIATGSSNKKDICLSMGATHFVDRNSEDFVATATAATTGGVDCVFDCVGGPYFAKNLASLALDSTYVFYGLLGGFEVADSSFLKTMLMKRITLKPTTLRSRSDTYKGALILDFAMDVLPKIFDDTYKILIDKEFNMFDGGAQEAHDRMEANANIGKIVLKVKEEEMENKGPEQLLKAGDAKIEEGDFVRAAELLTEALVFDGTADALHSQLLCSRAAAHAGLGDFETAEIDAGEALSLNRTSVRACMLLARYSLELRMLDQSESAITLGLKLERGDEELLKLQVDVKLAKEKAEKVKPMQKE